MKDLLVDISPDRYEVFAINATKQWNAYLKERILVALEHVLSKKQRILDIGMGTGHMLFELFNEEKLKNYDFYGVDIDPEMVSFCKEKCNKLNLTSFNITEASVSNLPFYDNYFSVIYARSVIHHWADPKKGLQELCRVLDKGGIIIIHEPLADAKKEALDLFNKNRKLCGLNDMSIEEKYTFSSIKNLLAECSIEGITYEVKRGEGLASLGCELFIQKIA